jgi:type I restriction enzyme S subunit
MNVHDSEFDVKGLAYIDSQQAQKLAGVTVEEGDVLLNITGASLTRTCLVPSILVPARVNQHVSILRVKPELINEHYLQLFLVCARTKSLLWEIGGSAGSTRQALTKKDLEELVVKYPLALEAQNMIVEEANKLASAITEFVGLIDAKLTAAKNLRQSILEAAFAGDL